MSQTISFRLSFEELVPIEKKLTPDFTELQVAIAIEEFIAFELWMGYRHTNRLITTTIRKLLLVARYSVKHYI